MWDIEFHKTVALEIGVGIDIGLFSGTSSATRRISTANGDGSDCSGPLRPPMTGPNDVPYCDVPENGSYNARTGTFQSDKANRRASNTTCARIACRP